jgi:lysophospholipase L1-like esterase
MASPELAPVPPEAPTPDPEISGARRVIFFSVPFLFFFSLLGAVEWVVRRTQEYVSPLEAFVRAPEQRGSFVDRYQVSVFEGDPLLFWRIRPNLGGVIWDFTLFSTNGQGIRYPLDIGAKRPGVFRIASFGDSVTFGYRIPTVWPERPTEYDPGQRTYTQVLENALRASNPGREIEVIPYAVPGYTSHQGVAWARREIPRIQADVVTACFGWNDINLRKLTDRESMSTTREQVMLRRIMMRSQALIHASLLWQRGRGQRDVPADHEEVVRVPDDEYVQNIEEIARMAQRHRAGVVVIGPVYRDPDEAPDEAERLSAHRDILRAAMEQIQIPYLEIEELTERGWPDNDVLFGEKIHPNAAGHRLMAKALLQVLIDSNMLKDLEAPDPESIL